MTLAPHEYARVQYLLGKHQVTRVLTDEEREELRALLGRESPVLAKRDFEALVDFGLVLVGARELQKTLRALTG